LAEDEREEEEEFQEPDAIAFRTRSVIKARRLEERKELDNLLAAYFADEELQRLHRTKFDKFKQLLLDIDETPQLWPEKRFNTQNLQLTSNDKVIFGPV